MTELQLEFIRKFGRKELTEGLIFEWNTLTRDYSGYWKVGWVTNKKRYSAFKLDGRLSEDINLFEDMDKYEILGHPVQWHDVFARLVAMNYTISCSSGSLWRLLYRRLSLCSFGSLWRLLYRRLSLYWILRNQESSFLDTKDGLLFFDEDGGDVFSINCNLCLSPMLQPELIEQLLLLSN